MKNYRSFFLFIIITLSYISISAQTIKGKVTSSDKAIAYANLVIDSINIGVSANDSGTYFFNSVPLGNHFLLVSAIGMNTKKILINVKDGVNIIDIELESTNYNLNQVVISATKTNKKITDSPVIVSVISNKFLNDVQACNLAEGLNYQTGLRIEYNCQTCNYTQVRMNGLNGSYSQILINSRPIFSSLIGLYGLEQIPSNMINRIEIIRGGGSSLYGSSAIGGVINVITKIPDYNKVNVSYDFYRFKKNIYDQSVSANSTLVNENKNFGVTLSVNKRERMAYDHNGDNFSELPYLNNKNFNFNIFLVPSNNQKLELNLGSLQEYRYGGEMIDEIAHFAMQSEERIHEILIANLDYQIDFNNKLSELIIYLAGQKADREHYTGIRPQINTYNDSIHLINPPYGKSFNKIKQFGIQLNHKHDLFLKPNTLTIGSELITDDILDKIDVYNYRVDQQVNKQALYLQSDWDITKRFNFLSGLRFDKHSLISDLITSPRIAFLYKIKKNIQLRTTYSTGFRAPQAFDSDLHLAFAGGGVSRIILADDLVEERSNSISSSINFDQVLENYIWGFTIEAFNTHLNNAFYQDPVGADDIGEVFVKRNGSGATVKGVTIDLRANINNRVNIESGFTFQESIFGNAVKYSDHLEPIKEFLKTPNTYGYASVDLKSFENFSFNANLVNTGKMNVLHLAGSPNQNQDEYKISPVFNVIGLKASYKYLFLEYDLKLVCSVGVKNIANSYQEDFDISKNRDSNYMYGPSLPRTYYVSVAFSTF